MAPSPNRLVSGTRASVKEDLVELGSVRDLTQRPHFDAGLLNIDGEVGEALCFATFGSVGNTADPTSQVSNEVHTFCP